jgi:hypothetical protein
MAGNTDRTGFQQSEHADSSDDEEVPVHTEILCFTGATAAPLRSVPVKR